tara:strand:+ start:224 stop:457 length:234 start_codon:yes stop_codon:yes gene_type:complete
MGFLRPKTPTPPPPPITRTAPIVAPVKKKIADTTQPGDEGGGSKKGTGRGGTILTSVTGVNTPAQLGVPTLLGGMYQ